MKNVQIHQNTSKEFSGAGTLQWRSLGLFSSEATHRAQRGEKMLGGSGNLKKKWALEEHFPNLNG